MPQWVQATEVHPRRGLFLRTQLPFAAGVVAVVVSIAVTSPGRLGELQLQLGVLATAIAAIATLVAPWERWHPLWRLILSGLNLAAVGLLLQAVGDVLNATFVLLSFPLLWMAFSFGTVGAVGSLFGAVGVIWLPELLYGEYPEDGRAWSELSVLTVLVVAVIAIIATQARRFRLANESARRSSAERERAVAEREQALAETEQVGLILSSVAEEVSVALVFLDEQHNVILNNKASRDLAALGGFDAETGSLQHAYIDGGTVPLPPHQQPVMRVTAGETIHDFLYWVGPPGQQRAILNNGRPVIDALGRYRGAVLVGHDITDLLDALRVREESLATLSHELRTPLTAMIGHLELLEDAELPAALQRPLQAMSRGAEQLLDLASRFLAASSPTLAPVMTSALLSETVARTLEQLPARNTASVPIAIDIPDDLRIEADHAMLQSLLDILLRNAIAYTDDGEITLTAARVDGSTEISVTDTGMGIPKADMPRIYDRFHRGANVIAREIRGTGLGLAVARTIAHAHRAQLSIQSTEGEGTKVLLSMP